MGRNIFFSTILITFSIILFNNNSYAANESDYSSQFNICMKNNEMGITNIYLQCMSEETDLQKKRLNKYYNKAMAQLDPNTKKILSNYQRGWQLMYDNEYDLEYIMSGGEGSAANLGAAGSHLDHLVDRVKYLKELSESIPDWWMEQH